MFSSLRARTSSALYPTISAPTVLSHPQNIQRTSQAIRPLSTQTLNRAHYRPISTTCRASRPFDSMPRSLLTPSSSQPSSRRTYATSTSAADRLVEEIQEQYATARDEFEIACEETEKTSIYAEGDRQAAREEMDKLRQMFDAACANDEGGVGDDVRRRVGHRIRELENAVEALMRKGEQEP